MSSTNNYPDGLTQAALARISVEVSAEIEVAAPTPALLDGSALERRNRRIAARAQAGIVAQYGVTQAQALRESEGTPLPVITATFPEPVFGKPKSTKSKGKGNRVGRKARRLAARTAATMGRVA
ncbi:hypothetical protein [Umezawaea sp. NPDC059074]|uniref:hypothetical protein n=1 Tax=Umezawaea sp. NPDC059074 TaxID=3346716 RepID=UPI0036990FBE